MTRSFLPLLQHSPSRISKMATKVILLLSSLLVCRAYGSFTLSKEVREVNCTNAMHKPHPNPCRVSSFILCANGMPYAVMTCPTNLVFSKEELNCVQATEISQLKPANCSFDNCDDVDWNGKIEVKDDCKHYYQCDSGHRMSKMPCQDGLFFIPYLFECQGSPKSSHFVDPDFWEYCEQLHPTEPPTEPPTELPTEETSLATDCADINWDGKVAVKGDCKLFTMCYVPNMQFTLDCPVNTYFDGACTPFNQLDKDFKAACDKIHSEETVVEETET